MSNSQLETMSSLESLKLQLLSTLDEHLFFSLLMNYLKSEISCDSWMVFRALDDGLAQLLLGSNVDQVSSQMVFKKGDSLSGHVITTRRPYFTNNVNRDPLFAHFKVLIPKSQAELAIPFLSSGSVLATLHFIFENEGVFTAELVEKIQRILKDLDSASINMKLFLEAKKLNDTLLKKIELKEKEMAKKVPTKNSFAAGVLDSRIIGNSPEIKNLLTFVGKIAASKSNILILGESGTGKELVARKLHCQSERANSNYVVVNCGAIQESLLESEFFGHEKGSFTGASFSKEGLVEKADGGTLFLDEVGELSLTMQTKLLRFLEQKEAYRVGSATPYHVDVRVIAATNRDLKEFVNQGKFREDLYYRLSTLSIELPSLRQRKDDIALLANHFLNDGKNVDEVKTLTPGAISVLRSYNWPGNIRELKNVMERAYILSDGKFIDEGHLSDCVNMPEVAPSPLAKDFKQMSLSELEKEHIAKTLEYLNGNKTKTAKILGITVKTLYNKLHSYNLLQKVEDELVENQVN